MATKNKEAWIGLANILPRPGNRSLGTAIGAVVPVLALAGCQEEYVAIVATVLGESEFDVIEIEDIEPFTNRLQTMNVEQEVISLARSLTDEQPYAFGVFHSYTSD